MGTIEAQVRALIADSLGISNEECAPSALLRDDLQADSMDMTQLTIELENKFSIIISDVDGDDMRTVQDVVNLVERRVVQ